MEETLNPSVEPAGESVQPQAAPDGDVVYLSDLNTASDEGSTVEGNAQADEQAASETHADGAQQPEQAENQNVGTSKDFSAALNKRTAEIQAREQAKYESSDEYQFGRMMLQQRAARENITVQEARRRYEQEQVSSQAAEYQRDPKKFFEDYVRTQNGTPPVQQAQPQQLQSEAAIISQQIVEARENGLLPESFSPADATPAFISDIQRFGIEGAARLFAVSKPQAPTAANIADELERRRSAPRPMRPASQGGGAGAPRFDRMTDEQFKKIDADIERAIMEGKRIR